MEGKKIWIGNDHGGYELKLAILEYLEEKGWNMWMWAVPLSKS